MLRNASLTALVAASALMVVACQSADESTQEPPPTPTARASVTILEPGPSAKVDPGTNVSIQFEASDEGGVGRVELWLDDNLVDSDETPPGGDLTDFQGFLFWRAESPGEHTIQMKSYSVGGALRGTVAQKIGVTDNPEVESRSVVRAAAATGAGSQSSASSRSAASGATAGNAGSPATTAPKIQYFRATVDEAAPGDMVTLEWDAPGATRGFLYYESPDGSYGSPREVYPKGTIQVTIDPDDETSATFTLSMLNNSGLQAERQLEIPLTAKAAAAGGAAPGGSTVSRQWFFSNGPDEAPNGSAVVSWGAQQHYEHGIMIWVDKLDQIYVLYHSNGPNRWESYPDYWDEDMLERDESETPPEGAKIPERGFGLLWRTHPAVREGVGWPWDEEVGAQTAVQSMDTEGGVVTFIQNLYSGVFRLEPDGTWDFIAEPEPTAEPPATAPAATESGESAG